MDFLTQEEVTMIFYRWLNRRVPRIKEPTKFICTLCTESGYGKYLHVSDSLSRPENSKFVYEFEVENPDDPPDLEQLRQCVEKEWDFLSDMKRTDYLKELKEIQENT
jgi:hypothetical protein